MTTFVKGPLPTRYRGYVEGELRRIEREVVEDAKQREGNPLFAGLPRLIPDVLLDDTGAVGEFIIVAVDCPLAARPKMETR